MNAPVLSSNSRVIPASGTGYPSYCSTRGTHQWAVRFDCGLQWRISRGTHVGHLDLRRSRPLAWLICAPGPFITCLSGAVGSSRHRYNVCTEIPSRRAICVSGSSLPRGGAPVGYPQPPGATGPRRVKCQPGWTVCRTDTDNDAHPCVGVEPTPLTVSGPTNGGRRQARS